MVEQMSEEGLIEASDVVVLSATDDSTAEYFVEQMRALDVNVAWMCLNSPEVLYSFEAFLRNSEGKRRPALYVRCPGCDDQILGSVLTYLTDFLDEYPGVVINGSGRFVLNGSKPLQCARLWTIAPLVVGGIPTSLVRPVPKAYLSSQNEWIAKSVSGERSEVVPLEDIPVIEEGTQPASCPVQIQRRICGRNVRVHVCQSQVIAIELKSSILDYRSDPDLRGSRIDLSPEMEQWCITAARDERLAFVGIDLIQSDSDGSWHCFEMNPSPGYEFFERLISPDGSSLPITRAILEYLLS